MGWRDVLELLEQVGGKEELIVIEAMQQATLKGKGTPDVQKRIARSRYRRIHRKEIEQGQGHLSWERG